MTRLRRPPVNDPARLKHADHALLCRLADGRFLFVLFDCNVGLPITVFREGMVVRREGKGVIRLEVPDGFC